MTIVIKMLVYTKLYNIIKVVQFWYKSGIADTYSYKADMSVTSLYSPTS